MPSRAAAAASFQVKSPLPSRFVVDRSYTPHKYWFTSPIIGSGVGPSLDRGGKVVASPKPASLGGGIGSLVSAATLASPGGGAAGKAARASIGGASAAAIGACTIRRFGAGDLLMDRRIEPAAAVASAPAMAPIRDRSNPPNPRPLNVINSPSPPATYPRSARAKICTAGGPPSNVATRANVKPNYRKAALAGLNEPDIGP